MHIESEKHDNNRIKVRKGETEAYSCKVLMSYVKWYNIARR